MAEMPAEEAVTPRTPHHPHLILRMMMETKGLDAEDQDMDHVAELKTLRETPPIRITQTLPLVRPIRLTTAMMAEVGVAVEVAEARGGFHETLRHQGIQLLSPG